MNDRLKTIIDSLSSAGKMIFFDGADKNDVLNFEKSNNIKLPDELKEWYLYSDGGEFFLPAGVQLFGIKHEPVIDINNPDRPNEKYFVIGCLSSGDSILCERDSNRISIYNRESGIIENDETYADFYEFLVRLPEVVGVE